MEHQFDELAKALADGMSRREALRRVGGGLAAALLVSLGWSREAWGNPTRAECKTFCGSLKGKAGNQCMSVCLSCSSTSCVSGPAGAKTCCTGGKVCSSGSCVCPSGQTDCGGTCVDTNTDRNNCGGCGSQSSTYVCRTDQVCSSGGCQCPTGQTDCSGTCVDTATDKNNCGGCAGAGGSVCSLTQVCSAGSCTCPQDYVPCGPGCCDPQGLLYCYAESGCHSGYACRYPDGNGFSNGVCVW